MTRDLFVVGLSHHSTPIEIREALAFEEEAIGGIARTLRDEGALAETMVVSTCNRVEIYASAPSSAVGRAHVRAFLRSRAGALPIEEHLYERWNQSAIEHAFRVTASLDSMIVGEPQILGQMKQAYDAAASAGTMGTLLGRCMTHAFRVAKRVRTETEIAEGSVSVSSVSCELARKIFGDLEGRRALLVGAGEMGEAAAKSFARAGAKLIVVNRNPGRARQIADAFGGEPRGYEDLASELITADVVVTSTASPKFIIGETLMREVVRARRRRPLFLIDIAVPRDVDPRIGNLDNVFLYDVDDLQQLASHALHERKRAAELAEQIVHEEVATFLNWQRALDLTPTIVALREQFRTVVQAELTRALSSWPEATAERRAEMLRMGDSLVNKLLHRPLTRLKDGLKDEDGAALLDATQRLFDLDTLAGEGSEVKEAPATKSLVPTRSGDES